MRSLLFDWTINSGENSHQCFFSFNLKSIVRNKNPRANLKVKVDFFYPPFQSRNNDNLKKRKEKKKKTIVNRGCKKLQQLRNSQMWRRKIFSWKKRKKKRNFLTCKKKKILTCTHFHQSAARFTFLHLDEREEIWSKKVFESLR